MKDEYADRLRGISNQDQELSEIASTWNQTDLDMMDEFLQLLELESVSHLRHMIDDTPDQWLRFVQKCCLAGLRQAVLHSA